MLYGNLNNFLIEDIDCLLRVDLRGFNFLSNEMKIVLHEIFIVIYRSMMVIRCKFMSTLDHVS
jgi:hypothetical protein